MPFSDFQGSWWVQPGAEGETEGHEIRISVMIECLSAAGDNPFGYAEYVEDDKGQRIQIYGVDNQPAYHVTYKKVTDKNTITCTPLLVGPGSWTAEDNSGGGGDGEDKPGNQ
jgi:hypothetical protein